MGEATVGHSWFYNFHGGILQVVLELKPPYSHLRQGDAGHTPGLQLGGPHSLHTWWRCLRNQ
jgi:hypothetical protein